MRYAVYTLTRGGVQCALRLQEQLPGCEVFTLPKWSSGIAGLITGTLADFVKARFFSYDIHIFIMASGIAVRTIAPLLQDKTTDPGVLVMDEMGAFVISLVSGHLGGANRAAREVARLMGAEPVITTASDVTGKWAVDELAQQLGCVISDMAQAKKITSMIVNGRKVALIPDIPLPMEIPSYLTYSPDEAEGILYITNKIPCKQDKPSVHLIPRTIIAGVGCRKGTSKQQILQAVTAVFSEQGLDPRSLHTIGTIDIKQYEAGLLEAAQELGVKILFFSAARIREVEHLFQTSSFVRDRVGCGAVAEPCAYLGADGKGTKIVPKTLFPGITIALFEREPGTGPEKAVT